MKKRLFALFITLIILLSLCACGGGSKPSVSDNGGGSDAPEIKVLRVGMDGEPSKYFENTGGGYGPGFYAWGCYTTLWMYTTDGQLHYLLGTSYEYNNDNTELTIHIRSGAKFANGDPITADDVLYSLEAEHNDRGDRTASVDFDKTRATDDTTLLLALKTRIPTQIEDLALLNIGSRKWTENGTNEDHMHVNVLESGAYYLPNGWTTGAKMIMEKNPYYWDKDSLVYDRIEVSFIPEENTRYLEFTTGGFDLCMLGDSKNIDSIKADSKYTLYHAPFQCNVGLMLDTSVHPTFANQDLRLAIMYAVDVKTIVDTICGSAYVKATSMLPSTSWAYKNTEYVYDPDLARQYYEKSGVKDFSWTLTINNQDPNKDIAEAIQAYLAEIGITMYIDVVDMPTFFSLMGGGAMDSTITQYSGSYDPGGVLNSWLSTSNNNMNKPSPEIQELLDQACTSLADQAARTQMFYQLQDEVKDYGKVLPLFEKTTNFAEANGVDCSSSVQADGYLVPMFLK